MSDHSLSVPGVRGPRLLRVALSHLLSTVVFGLVAVAGVAALAGQPSSGVPWAVAGLGGAAGSVAILVAALLARRVAGDPAAAARYAPVARVARLVMLVAAVVAAATGVLLAPDGVDRGFSITVNVGLAVALALFALLDTDLGRELRRAG
jgi:hypothetical protein